MYATVNFYVNFICRTTSR